MEYAIGHCVPQDNGCVDKTQKEILEEIAKALGNTGQQLEDAIGELRKLDKMLEETSDDDEYNALVDRFNELRRLALVRREMLMIHREAIKIYKHSIIDVFYPIPDKKKKRAK